jgi:hypothetical protein
MFTINQSMPKLINSGETLLMILKELQVVGGAIAQFTRVQQEFG